MMIEGFLAIQENADKIILLVEMMCMGQKDLPCFKDGEQVIRDLKARIFPNGSTSRMTSNQATAHINTLLSYSIDNWRTNLYDRF